MAKMTLTQKESMLLEDLKKKEELCIEKYKEGAKQACDKRLQRLFQELGGDEETHLDMLNQISDGKTPVQQKKPVSAAMEQDVGENTCTEEMWQKDRFLCADALSAEKGISSAYDTDIFEFAQPPLRDALNTIQKQEQVHGQKIYQYMADNNMY